MESNAKIENKIIFHIFKTFWQNENFQKQKYKL